MKLKKLAIKFLTMALSLLTLFQVGCGSKKTLSYKFETFEEMENFLLEEAIYGYNQLYLEEAYTKFCVRPVEDKLVYKIWEYLRENNQSEIVFYVDSLRTGYVIHNHGIFQTSADVENLKIKPFKHIGYDHQCVINSQVYKYSILNENGVTMVYSLPQTITTRLFDYSTEPVEFCDCLIYLFGLEEACDIKHKQYNSGEFTFEHDCINQKLRIIWNGEDHSECFLFNNIYPGNEHDFERFYKVLRWVYAANCENCLNLINIPTELLNEWGLEYIHNDIHLYTLDPTNAPEGNARIVKIH